MTSGVTRISDVVVPEIFTPYSQLMTQEKSRLIQSGAIVVDAELSNLLNGGGLTFNQPFFKDLDNDEENVSNDDPTDESTPNKIGTGSEVQVRLSRNNSWSSMDLTAALAGADPMAAIASRVADYWVRRLQLVFVATMNGVLADNAAAPSGGDTHTQNDMIHDISGAAFVDGVTNFSAEAFVDGAVTMGDGMDDLTMVMMHSLVYARALKNNLIDFMPDSDNFAAVPNTTGPRKGIPTFLGREVIVDDGMPSANGVFDTWLFGAGAFQFGAGSPAVPTETDRKPETGNGGGQDILYNRVEWTLHPVGYAYVGGTTAKGGPSNLATSGNLANAATWRRVFNERKQIRMARLVTREY
jgi:hypothetical protein